jgi:hypothetical protein
VTEAADDVVEVGQRELDEGRADGDAQRILHSRSPSVGAEVGGSP